MGLVELFERGRVWHNIPGFDAGSAIHNAVAALRSGTVEVFPEELEQSILEREQLASTAIGHALAVPHPRTPLEGDPGQARIALFYPRFPVPWGAADGRPVRSFFLILSVGSAEHLKNLSGLSKLCTQEEFRALLEREAGLDELVGYVRRASAKSR